MVIAQSEEVLGANLLVELHQRIRIPTFSLEEGQDVLEAHFRRMSVVLAVEFIFPRAFHIEAACHPVARAFNALRSPVRPDAELGIAEPFGHLVGAERFPRGFKLACGHGLVIFKNRDGKILGTDWHHGQCQGTRK